MAAFEYEVAMLSLLMAVVSGFWETLTDPSWWLGYAGAMLVWWWVRRWIRTEVARQVAEAKEWRAMSRETREAYTTLALAARGVHR